MTLYSEIIREGADEDLVLRSYFSIGIAGSSRAAQKYDDAREAYNSVIRQFPNSSLVDDTLFYLSRMESVQLGDYAKAAEYLELARTRFGGITFDEHPMLKVKPFEDINSEKLGQQIAGLKAAAADVASAKANSLELATIYRRNGSPLPAERVLRKIIEADPERADSADALMLLADLCATDYLAQVVDPYEMYIGGVSATHAVSRRGELNALAVACYENLLEFFPKSRQAASATLLLAQACIAVPFAGEIGPQTIPPSTASHGDQKPDFARAEKLAGGVPLLGGSGAEAAKRNLMVGDAYAAEWRRQGATSSSILRKVERAYAAAAKNRSFRATADHRLSTLRNGEGQ